VIPQLTGKMHDECHVVLRIRGSAIANPPVQNLFHTCSGGRSRVAIELPDVGRVDGTVPNVDDGAVLRKWTFSRIQSSPCSQKTDQTKNGCEESLPPPHF
jgi:hypothetical protein